jgi:hypothetical protein
MSTRGDILDNIVTTLQTITIAGGYNCDVGEVIRNDNAWSDWGGNDDWPKICLVDMEETSKPEMGYHVENYYWIIGIHLFSKGDNAREEIDDLMVDVRTAMFADLTRGGFAFNT